MVEIAQTQLPTRSDENVLSSSKKCDVIVIGAGLSGEYQYPHANTKGLDRD